MQLRLPVSEPPSPVEMRRIHQLHQGRILQSEGLQSNTVSSTLPVVSDFTFRASCVVFPEQRNVHGKLFGGFVMTEAQNLAQYTATFLAQGEPVISLGIDEAIFLQPIGYDIYWNDFYLACWAIFLSSLVFQFI
jgi:acyl-coenzyme A thioesterase 9